MRRRMGRGCRLHTDHAFLANQLVLLGALGGWPGGVLGMKVFRHKTAKRLFQFKYALALIPFAAEIWIWLQSR